MSISVDVREDLQRLLLTAFPNESDYNEFLLLKIGPSLEDLAPQGTRPQKYLLAIIQLAARGMLEALLDKLFERLPEGDARRDEIAALYVRIWPGGRPEEAHRQLLPSNVAFVNRDGLRNLVNGIAVGTGPRAVVLHGRSLAGASFSWHLICHVAHAYEEIDAVLVDLDRILPIDPGKIMGEITLRLSLGAAPTRIDLIGADDDSDENAVQYARSLAAWFLGKAGERGRETRRPLWLVLDNSHRATVPEAARELVHGLVQAAADGIVRDFTVFVLGADPALATVNPFAIEEAEVFPLATPDVVSYFALVNESYGSLGDYSTPSEATEALLSHCGCNLAAPETGALIAMTRKLTEIVRGIQ